MSSPINKVRPKAAPKIRYDVVVMRLRRMILLIGRHMWRPYAGA